MAEKLNLYMKSGVSEYWIVDLENKTILQYSFSPERDIEHFKTYKKNGTIKSSAFKDLEITMADIIS